ncbi:MAG: beta-ketoacyl synthase [Chloroflexi bacterium]|nr:MAG: beta-ketoacyl synthase [Chloroflexota bacterium]
MKSKIAIIGIACLFPGADTPQAFWQILMEGKRTTSDATAAQLGADPTFFYDPTRTRPDTSYFLHGGYIEPFRVDPTNQLGDSVQWTLYTAQGALNDAGYLQNADILKRTGLIIGNLSLPTRHSRQVFTPIYHALFNQALGDLIPGLVLPPLDDLPAYPYNALSPGYPAEVVSAALGLGRTSFALDAACASSLYALDLACRYLQTGKADMMLAGAVSAADPLFVNLGFAHLGGFPDHGEESLPLDTRSGGLIAGEGAGMFVLKRYADAIRDGDKIYALVSGIGLANDGRGKHILTPNSKGQVLALQRAYLDAGIRASDVDYVECHASGTPVGDTTEMTSMAMFFGENDAPKIGSVKSNVGHLMTAAGMASMIKLILALAHQQLPPTIKVESPLNKERFSHAHIVTQHEPWQPGDHIRRAGVNAFGFGGVSAHVILEEVNQTVTDHQPTQHPINMAIIGMDAHFGMFDGLDAFSRAIYEGETAFRPLPENRWKGLQHQPQILKRFGLDEVPHGAYIDSFDLDFMQVKIPPNPADEPIPQQLLLLKVADNAIRDAGLTPGSRVAVLVALGTELSLHQYRGRADLNWQIKQALQESGVNLTPEQIAELERISKDALLTPAQVNHYTSYIANIAASRVSGLWDFSGPSFTISSEENSAFKALEVANMLLQSGDVDAVVLGAVDLSGGLESVLMRHGRAPIHKGQPTAGIDQNANGWLVGEGAGAIVLTRADHVANRHVYATIHAVSIQQAPDGAVDADVVAAAAQDALKTAKVEPSQIGYLELHASGIEPEVQAEMEGIAQVYRGTELRTAVGSVKANIGHTYAASGIASLIKTALALSQRYIPMIPNWTAPKSDVWQETCLWVANKSRTWFDEKRIAAINSVGTDGAAAHVILAAHPQPARDNGYLAGGTPVLLPVAAQDQTTLLNKLDELLHHLDQKSLPRLADEVYADYAAQNNPAHVVALVGRDSEDIRKEAYRAKEGISNGADWSTPMGSAYTPHPVGNTGHIAFVYPGAFNTYPKLGYDLIHLFPTAYDALQQVKTNVAEAVAERLLYPRSLEKPSLKLTRAMKEALANNPVAMIESGLSFALMYTYIMRQIFNLQPHAAFGYSLGEGSMMWGMGVWRDGDAGSKAFRESSLFSTRLTGSMQAVRDAWGVAADVPNDQLWAAYFIAAPVEQIRAAVQTENKVYLTHINTPNEAMIAGEPAACERVVAAVQGESMKAPFDVVIHNEAMMSEFGEFFRLHNLPTHPVEGVTFYSAADYAPIQLEQRVIANNLARMACKQIDFPRLIERAYADGARVFIELGPRSTCARWIDETLGDRPHLAVSIDQMGVETRLSLIKMLAQLVAHHVPINIAPLYRPLPQTPERSLVRTVQLGGQDVYGAIVNEANLEKFAVQGVHQAQVAQRAKSFQTAMPAGVSTVHTNFLKTRQDSLKQMADLITQQMQQLAGGYTPPPTTAPSTPQIPPPNPAPPPSKIKGIRPMYDYDAIETFALRRIADTYGERYAIYDNRRAPRIPNGDLLLISRVLDIQGERYKPVPGTTITSEYDVPVDAWYFRDNPYPTMPYSVLMEIALQPCGLLSAYHGPTLEFPEIDFYFRNLDGQGKLYTDKDMRGRTITNHVTLVNNTVMSGTIIQKFTFKLYDGDDLYYEGDATFGYFTIQALTSQAGLDAGKIIPRWYEESKPKDIITINPHQPYGDGFTRLARNQLMFTDEIKIVLNGGKYGKGYAYGNTIIDPAAWFFKNHFYQDPVMPGSIGVETMMQALQAFCIASGLTNELRNPHFAHADGGHNIVWKYRGQILSDSEKSHVEVNVKEIIRRDGEIIVIGDASLWRDKLRIYEVKNIALSICET